MYGDYSVYCIELKKSMVSSMLFITHGLQNRNRFDVVIEWGLNLYFV